MSASFYGRCDHCYRNIGARHYGLSRHIEQYFYPLPDLGTQTVQLSVLYAEELTKYCCSDCSEVGAYEELYDRGIELNEILPGPVAPCSKCGKLMDLRLPHVAYELMDQTEIRKPWLISVEPDDSRTVARICAACDGNLETETETETDAVDGSGDSPTFAKGRFAEFSK